MMSFTAGKYTITSHGNGWAYEVTDNETGQSLWVQDQDATELEKETDKFEDLSYLDNYFFNLCD